MKRLSSFATFLLLAGTGCYQGVEIGGSLDTGLATVTDGDDGTGSTNPTTTEPTGEGDSNTGDSSDSSSAGTEGSSEGATTNPTTTGEDPTSSGSGSGGGDGDGDDTSSGDGDSTSSGSGDGDGDPPPLNGGCDGYATRFWDCCKPHCGWDANVPDGSTPVGTCNAANQSNGNNYDIVNSCEQQSPNAGYTCFNMAPWSVNANLAYGFAAVPANGDICGRCYQLEFDGTGHYNADDPGSVALGGKTMIVQAVNIGFDVGGGQFDVLIPGGGVGAFDACSSQWNVNTNELGATYGGFLTQCQQQNGDNFQQIKQCVMNRCASVFDEPNHGDLVAGCDWFVNWFETADNPNLDYQEVECPQALINVSGISRPGNDLSEACGAGDCSQEQMDACDCSWTNGGQNCGGDDGSCCWQACCG